MYLDTLLLGMNDVDKVNLSIMLGEVFTSLELVEEMLDKLPKEVWSNPNLKWLVTTQSV